MTTWIMMAVLAQGYYSADEARALFAEANNAYARADYAKAREDYEKLVTHGQAGADVLYNLGTTALAMGDLGSAVLYLERARRAGGRADDVDANLSVARSKQLDQVVGASADTPFLERVVEATSDQVTGWVFLACWAGAFALLIALRFLRSGRGWALAGAILLFACALPAGALLGAHAYARQSFIDAVVTSATLPARELPQDNAKVSFEIHAGLKVRLMEQAGNFVKVRLPNGLEGWSPKDGVTPI
jgi:tetratricopeptide (TPR) repeat protein